MRMHEEAGFANTIGSKHGRLAEFASISCRILLSAMPGVLRADFLRDVCRTLIGLSGYDAIELRFKEDGKSFRCVATDGSRPFFSLETLPVKGAGNGRDLVSRNDSPLLTEACRQITERKSEDSLSCFTPRGSFWTSDLDDPDSLPSEFVRQCPDLSRKEESRYRSVAVIPFSTSDEELGLLCLKCEQPGRLDRDQVEFFEGLAQILGVAFGYRRRGLALRERVKELTCLYGIARLVKRFGKSLDEILTEIARLLPPAWLHPEITCGRIVLDGRSYMTANYRAGCDRLKSDLMINDVRRGFVEVVYTQKMPDLDEGPFLKEERSLIDIIAREISVFIERWEAEDEKWKLQQQLRHADRLATIGQLAAGVAHELNEPLGNILGFAQLASKSGDMPEHVDADLGKIISASLQAREVIRKLMVFARQTPSRMSTLDLNEVVAEGLSFLEARIAKENIEMVCSLTPSMQPMSGDPGQLNQVLVNLVVNALQAMPDGGTLTVKTECTSDIISLVVEDTGIGMTEEVKSQIFMPFFTTKDVDEGTGLGLAVVHGIVGAHGGVIEVESEVCKGSCFTVYFPTSRGPISEEDGDNGASGQ
jgi:signal transduction histidine kinase